MSQGVDELPNYGDSSSTSLGFVHCRDNHRGFVEEEALIALVGPLYLLNFSSSLISKVLKF